MELSYTGLLFKRILVCTGYTYGKAQTIGAINLISKYRNTYKNIVKCEYAKIRKKDGSVWNKPTMKLIKDNETAFYKALHWLEDNGYINVRWSETVHVSRLCTGLNSFITVTRLGYSVANKYIQAGTWDDCKPQF